MRLRYLASVALLAGCAGTLVARGDRSDYSTTVDLLARVVRHDGHATGLDWTADHASEQAVARFLDELVRDQQRAQ